MERSHLATTEPRNRSPTVLTALYSQKKSNKNISKQNNKEQSIMGQINIKKRKQRIAYKNADYYVTRNITYSKISTEDVINYASENSGIPKAQMSSAYYALEQQILQFLFNGHSLELSSLGSFYLATNAHISDTEDGAGADAVYRTTVQFRQSKKLRELVNQKVKFNTESNSGSATKDSTESTDENTGE